MKGRLLSIVGLLCGSAFVAAAWPACSSPGGQGSPADGGVGDVADARDAGASVDSASDAEVQPVWDPVWHLTAPATYPQAGPDGQPSCGTGCRIALNWPVHSGRPSLMHAYTESAVADYGDDGLFFTRVGDTSSSLLVRNPIKAGVGQYGVAEPSLSGDLAAYVLVDQSGATQFFQLEVMSVVTGERKPAYRIRWGGASAPGPFATSLNGKYLFWAEDGVGLRSLSLSTGAVRTLVPGAFFCVNMAANDRGVLCCDSDRGIVTFTDQETGQVTAIDAGGGAQFDGELSPDRRWYVWVDYRDPPGRLSDYVSRSGGEIYLRDLAAGTTARLTFDSPDAPRAKTYPSTDGKIAVWNEIPDGLDPNPSSNTAVYDGSTTMVVLDLSTNKKCRVDLGIPYTIQRMSVHGRHVYGDFAGADAMHLADLNLDDPGLKWTCTP